MIGHKKFLLGSWKLFKHNRSYQNITYQRLHVTGDMINRSF